MVDAEALKYRAFLSYSHRDKALGEWLHRALERYRIDKNLVGRDTPVGPVPKSLRPIFRDREDFSAGHSLTEQTIAALEASQFLIVICSPNAARSKYVNEEIRRFKTFGRGHRVIPVIIAGEPGHPENECFPPALRFRIAADGVITDEREEPIAADVRPEGDGKDVGKLKVVAGILGLVLDEIVRREEQARRRRLRNWVAVLAVITAGFAGLAGLAEFNRRSADSNRLLAEQRQQEAERNFVVAKESIDTLVFDIADGLGEVEGMSTTAVRRILERAEVSVDRLVKAGNNDPGLLATRGAMLLYFSDVYGKHGDLKEQRSSIEAALDIFSFLSQARPNDAKFKGILSEVQLKLGDLFVVRGRLKEAGETFRERRVFLEKLLITDPSNLDRQTDLALTIQRIGNVLLAQGRLEAAQTAYQEYVALTGRLAESQPTHPVFQLNLAWAYDKMGNVEFMRMNLEESEAFYRRALSIREISTKADPTNASWQRDLAISLEWIGRVATMRDNDADALKSFQAALVIRQRLARTDAKNIGWQSEFALSLSSVGVLLVTQGSVPEGLKHHRDALEIAERAAAANPGNADWQRNLALVAMNAGDAFAKHAPPADALKIYLGGHAVAGRLARSGPDNPVQPRDAYVLHVIGLRVAGILSRLGQAAEALKYFRESAAIAERHAAADADSVQWQRALVTANRELAERGDQPAQRWAVVIDQLRKLIANGKQDKHDLFSLAEAEKGLAAAKR